MLGIGGMEARTQGAQSGATAAAVPDDPNPALIDLLLSRQVIGADAAARAHLVYGETRERAESVLTRLGLISEQRLAHFFAEEAQASLIVPARFPTTPTVPGHLSIRFLRDQRALPIGEDDESLRVAFSNPLDHYARSAIAHATGRRIEVLVALPSDIEAALDRLYGPESEGAGPDAAVDEEDLERLKDLASDAPAIRAVNRLIIRAGELQASDIHLEPAEDNLGVRFRVDGVMREMAPLPASMKQSLVSRIKIMAGLDIAERRLPQDGRMRIAVRGHEVDLRVATSPTIHGESVVMRLLDRSNLTLDFPALGFETGQSAAFLAQARKPHGIVLVTGPTGSGKTTTLYTALSAVKSAERKILTIEDPIEYRLAGISQTQVLPAIGLDFARALRSFLRQDPDIVMVGEIRDLETAQVAVQAALTGHTILSTLHTNSAAAAVTRLIDMGVEPFLITSSLNAVLAQRLVRRLCPQCSVPAPGARTALLAADIAPSVSAAGDDFRQPVGCDACGQRGFKGRLAMIELLPLSAEIAGLVLARADERDIERAAIAEGMTTLLQDGIDKAARGLTSIEEVLRVMREV